MLTLSLGRSMGMPALTRRRYPERQDCWHVHHGDVRVGPIAIRVGIRTIPMHRGGLAASIQAGERDRTSATLDQARTDFAAARAVLQPTRTEADLRIWALPASMDGLQVCDVRCQT